MNTDADRPDTEGPRAMAAEFPQPRPLVNLANRELHLAANGTKEQKATLGNPADLPRPWDPPSCREPNLRAELWTWLEQVVTWLNTEYVWDIGAAIPSCWPQHPHLVHEIAVLADQRRRAGRAETSDALEEWHRYALPSFTDRMKARLKNHCDDGHQTWPARSRHTRHTSAKDRNDREQSYLADTRSAASEHDHRPGRPRLAVLNLDTGDVMEGTQPR